MKKKKKIEECNAKPECKKEKRNSQKHKQFGKEILPNPFK